MFSLAKFKKQSATLIMAGVVLVSSLLGSGIAFADTPSASIEVSPSSAVPGETITVTGVGYPSYTTVSNLSIGEESALPSPTPATDDSGSFSVSLSVPPVCAGPQVLLATVGDVTSTTVLTILATNLAPNPSFENTGSPDAFGWIRDAKGTNAKLGLTGIAANGDRAVYVYASKPANQGWPGFTTREIICVDPAKEYTFSASYLSFANIQGMPWLDIALFDSEGKHVGSVSTGTSPVLEAPNKWHEKTYSFKPAALKKHFPDVAGVKLGLKLSMNHEAAGIKAGKPTLLVFDDVKFEAVEPEVSKPDLVVSIEMSKTTLSLNGQKMASNPDYMTITVKNVGTSNAGGMIKANIVNSTKDGVPWPGEAWWNDGAWFAFDNDLLLGPGEESTITYYPGDVPMASSGLIIPQLLWEPGFYTIQVEIDPTFESAPDGKFDEINEDNNLSQVIQFEILP